MSFSRIPASLTNPGFDAAGDPLVNIGIVGHNEAESKINFSPVANSWSDVYSIPGADIAAYEFDGSLGDVELGFNTTTREGLFIIEE